MKAELNEQNKGKFFALHIGGELALHEDVDTERWASAFITGILNGGVDLEIQFADDIGNASEEPEVESIYAWELLLKPLSSITDEDAILFGSLFAHSSVGDDLRWGKYWAATVIGENDPTKIHPYPLSVLNMCDFLRSKGYALPFMGLSVEEMVQAGWIELVLQDMF